MHVTVEVVGEGRRSTTSPDDDATYADLIREAGYHPQEASALVDGSPVPGDRPSTPNRSGCSGLSRADRRAAARERGGRPVRLARLAGILRVLDAAMLETDAETVDDAAIDARATHPSPGLKRTDAVVGALVATRPRVGPSSRRRRGGPAARGEGSAPRSSPRMAVAPSATPRKGRHRRVRSGNRRDFTSIWGSAVDSERDEVETGRLRGQLPGWRWQRRR